MPFDQRPVSESGFSFPRLKLSTVGSGSTGRTKTAGVVALATFEYGPWFMAASSARTR